MAATTQVRLLVWTFGICMCFDCFHASDKEKPKVLHSPREHFHDISGIEFLARRAERIPGEALYSLGRVEPIPAEAPYSLGREGPIPGEAPYSPRRAEPIPGEAPYWRGTIQPEI